MSAPHFGDLCVRFLTILLTPLPSLSQTGARRSSGICEKCGFGQVTAPGSLSPFRSQFKDHTCKRPGLAPHLEIINYASPLQVSSVSMLLHNLQSTHHILSPCKSVRRLRYLFYQRINLGDDWGVPRLTFFTAVRLEPTVVPGTPQVLSKQMNSKMNESGLGGSTKVLWISLVSRPELEAPQYGNQLPISGLRPLQPC